MLIIDISAPSPSPADSLADTTSPNLVMACRHFTIGKESWNRGLRELQRSYLATGHVTYLSNGSLRLFGLSFGDLILDAAEVSRALFDGLQIRSPDFEADIAAAAFRAALLPCSGTAGL